MDCMPYMSVLCIAEEIQKLPAGVDKCVLYHDRAGRGKRTVVGGRKGPGFSLRGPRTDDGPWIGTQMTGLPLLHGNSHVLDHIGGNSQFDSSYAPG